MKDWRTYGRQDHVYGRRFQCDRLPASDGRSPRLRRAEGALLPAVTNDTSARPHPHTRTHFRNGSAPTLTDLG